DPDHLARLRHRHAARRAALGLRRSLAAAARLVRRARGGQQLRGRRARRPARLALERRLRGLRRRHRARRRRPLPSPLASFLAHSGPHRQRPRPVPRLSRRPAALLLAVTIAASPAFAQIAPAEHPPLEQPALPGFLREAPRPGFVLPPPPPERGPRRSGLSVVVTRFRVTGATVLSESELQQVLAPWTGRRLGDEDLEEARRAITARYVAAGYINSGAVVPDQTIAGG